MTTPDRAPDRDPDRPGWYDDPHESEQLRYFDGIVWTSHTTPRRTRWDHPSPEAQKGETPGASADRVSDEAAPSGGRTGATPGRLGSPSNVRGSWDRGPYAGPDHDRGTHRPGPDPRQQGRPVPVGARPVPTTVDGVPLAPYGLRVVAYVVDQVIVGFLSFVVGAYWSVPMVRDSMDEMNAAIARGEEASGFSTTLDQMLTPYVIPLTLVSVAVALAYNAIFLSRLSATPGKLLVGISVRRVEHPGRISVMDALRRYALQSALDIAQLISFVGFPALMLRATDLLWPLGDGRRQALHDKVADTQVVVGRQPSGRQPGSSPG